MHRGRDIELSSLMKERLNAVRIEVEPAEGYLSAINPQNITNRGLRRRGVQFELTMALRKNAKAIEEFVGSVRAVLLEVQSSSIVRSK